MMTLLGGIQVVIVALRKVYPRLVQAKRQVLITIMEELITIALSQKSSTDYSKKARTTNRES